MIFFEKRIIHVDMDAFFAAVEMRDNPELVGLPLVIGALPSERGVVATCNYIARKYGIRSAQNIKEAHRLCPHAVYMHPNMGKYRQASDIIRQIWDAYTDIIEHISLDEGYLDVSASAHLFGGYVQIAEDIKRRTLQQTGLSCSVGIGYSKMSAKLASEEKKPDGLFAILNKEELLNLIIDRPTRTIYGIGAKSAQVLANSGIQTVRDILQNPSMPPKLLGKLGYEIVNLAKGIDPRPVGVTAPQKSFGSEHTFQRDIIDRVFLEDALLLIAKKLAFMLQTKGMYAKTITLKITFANMKQITRSKSGEYTNRKQEIWERSLELFKKVENRPIRLIGISLSGFSKDAPRQIDIFGNNSQTRSDALEQLILDLQYKYGMNIINTGREQLALKIIE